MDLQTKNQYFCLNLSLLRLRVIFNDLKKKKKGIFLPEKRSEDAKLLMKKITTLPSINR